MSALSQLLLNQFWPNFMSRCLQPFLTKDSCQGDICPGNICPGYFSFLGKICPTSTTHSWFTCLRWWKLSKPQLNQNSTKVGFDMLLTWFGPNFKVSFIEKVYEFNLLHSVSKWHRHNSSDRYQLNKIYKEMYWIIAKLNSNFNFNYNLSWD